MCTLLFLKWRLNTCAFSYPSLSDCLYPVRLCVRFLFFKWRWKQLYIAAKTQGFLWVRGMETECILNGIGNNISWELFVIKKNMMMLLHLNKRMWWCLEWETPLSIQDGELSMALYKVEAHNKRKGWIWECMLIGTVLILIYLAKTCMVSYISRKWC